jgi:hypothetical protein
MLHTSKEVVGLARSEEPNTLPVNEHLSSRLEMTEESQLPITKRSEVLRHVFTRPLRSTAPQSRYAISRITKSDYHKHQVALGLQSRPRVALHRYITSFFGSSHGRDAPLDSPQSRSRASSLGSRPNSSFHGSIPSLDLVSPGVFIFSGPSLHSRSSFSNSMSRFPSLAETDSDIYPMRRARTDSFSILDKVTILDDGVLEPIREGGITRTMSDVLLGVGTPFEEVIDPLLSDLHDETSLADRTGSHAIYARSTSSRKDVLLVTLLSPYLDFAA